MAEINRYSIYSMTMSHQNQNHKHPNQRRKMQNLTTLLVCNQHIKHHLNVKIIKELIWKLGTILNHQLRVVHVDLNVRVKLDLSPVLKLRIVIICVQFVVCARRIIIWGAVLVWSSFKIKIRYMVRINLSVLGVM